jgi:AraC-like DNA-binding protein
MPDANQAPAGFLSAQIRRGRYLFMEAERSSGADLVCAGWEECERDYVIEREDFRFHAVELLTGGAWEVKTGGGWKPAAVGTVLSYGPQAPIGIRARGQGPHWKYFADFRGAQSTALLRAARLDRRRVRRMADPGAAADLYEQLLRCSGLRTADRARLTGLLLPALLERIGAEREAGPGATWQSRAAFERCRHHLLENYPSIKRLGAAARKCHLTPEYFSRLFRQHTGQTAAQFLVRLRMDHAAKLLQEPGTSVKSAGLAVGYSDPYHFSRAFKRTHGVSPQSFRQRAG